MKYKQIKIGVEGFQTFHPIFSFYLLIKEKKMFENGWTFLVQFFLPAILQKQKKCFLFVQFDNLVSMYLKFLS